MKGLMFNNKYGLQDSVLDGGKTMTRRNVSNKLINQYEEWIDSVSCINVPSGTSYETIEEFLSKRIPYEIGEVVAIKQSYKDVGFEPEMILYRSMHEIDGYRMERADTEKGWNNKMFVCNNLMPHHIRITNIKTEKLQYISDEDCLKEGIHIGDFINTWDKYYYNIIGDCAAHKTFRTPKDAYASLIDKINGKGTWDKNCLVWAIEFELID